MPSSWIIGARSDCDLVVDAASVSGHHCRLSGEEAGFFLEDLNSTNGTFVNGVRLTPNVRVPLKPDDLVHLGSHALDIRSMIDRVDTRAADSLEFRGQEIVVGRTAASDRVIDRPMVSSRHARLFQVGNEILIEDLNSANGTFVNGKRIDRATVVRPGDKIGLGSYSLTLAAPIPDRPREVSSPGTTRAAEASPPTIEALVWNPWPVVALVAQAPIGALLLVALAGWSLTATLFGLVMAAVWFGLSTGAQAHQLGTTLARTSLPGSRDASLMARSLALAALTIVQCLVAWVLLSNAVGLRAASLPSLGYLALAGLAGLVLGLLTVSLVSNRRHVWSGIVALIVVFCLLGGWRPSLQVWPDAIRPLSGFTPSRWAFEGLLLLETGESEDASGGGSETGNTRLGLVDDYFPGSQRMGPVADALALVLMVLGLAILLGYVETSVVMLGVGRR